MYKSTKTKFIVRLIDNVFIPADEANIDYQQYLIWVSEGNTPEPADVEPVIVKDYKHFTGRDKQGIFTDAEKRAIYTAAYINPDIDVLLLVKEMDNAEYVTYSDQSMVQGLEILEAKGLITPERHQEIIAVMTAEREV